MKLARRCPGSGQAWAGVAAGVTNDDGRIGDLLPPSETVEPGLYRRAWMPLVHLAWVLEALTSRTGVGSSHAHLVYLVDIISLRSQGSLDPTASLHTSPIRVEYASSLGFDGRGAMSQKGSLGGVSRTPVPAV